MEEKKITATSEKVAPKKKATAKKATATKTTKTTKNATKSTPKRPKKEPTTKTTAGKKTEPVVVTPSKNILFVCSEATPFAGTGGLGEVMGSLPLSINNADNGYNATVIMPMYSAVKQNYRDKVEFMMYTFVQLAWRNQYVGLFRLVENGTTYYFIDNEYYFNRENLYGYMDDGERFAYFSKAVLEVLPYLGKVDVLACQDWQTALVPIYYQLYYRYYEGLEGIKTSFTIHNIEYQGKFDYSTLGDVFGIDAKQYGSIEHDGCINLVKGAMDYCDALTTVSPTYAQELHYAFYAHGLEKVVERNSHKMRGIINGIDTEIYNPTVNPYLRYNYSPDDMLGKANNKAELQAELGLPIDSSVPVVAIISRLVSHKGLDLIKHAMDRLVNLPLQLVVLGKGDFEYEEYFRYVANTHENVAAVIDYNKALSHNIYASADIFLMPSKSEPCGLSQMMACAYGTVPVVRATGGLNDTIVDCENGTTGNGFTFGNYDSADMVYAIERAVGLFIHYRDIFDDLVHRCMNVDFSWDNSSKLYVDFFNRLLENK